MLFVPRGSTAARRRLRVTVLDRAAAAACGGSRPIRRPDAAAVHQLEDRVLSQGPPSQPAVVTVRVLCQ